MKPKKRENETRKRSLQGNETKTLKNTKNGAPQRPKMAPKLLQNGVKIFLTKIKRSQDGKDWHQKAQNEPKLTPKCMRKGFKMESADL